MKQINRFVNQKKDRILYGVKIYLGMVIAGMLVLFMIARGNIDLILDKMLPETITILTSFLTIAASLIAMQIRMRLSFNRFSREEQSRINREAAKMPELHDFLITSDVLVFVIGLRSYLIRIDDILWAFGTEASKFHSSYSNGFSALIPRKQYEFILLLKDGTSISIPLRAEADNSRAEIAYAINVIQRKRPGVFTHFIVDHQTFWKKQFARIRETVEAAGTTDGAELEMQYNLEHWYQEPIPNYDPVQNEAIHGAIHSQTEGRLFLFLLFAIVLAGFLYYNIPDLIPVSTGFSGILETRILRLFLPGAIMTCIPLLTLFV